MVERHAASVWIRTDIPSPHGDAGHVRRQGNVADLSPRGSILGVGRGPGKLLAGRRYAATVGRERPGLRPASTIGQRRPACNDNLPPSRVQNHETLEPRNTRTTRNRPRHRPSAYSACSAVKHALPTAETQSSPGEPAVPQIQRPTEISRENHSDTFSLPDASS